jgi:AsmA protein
MKILKYLLIAAGIVGVVLVAVIGYIAATFDPNDYKPAIVQAVKDRTQRTLTLEGDIELSFWPNIGARIGRAALSERANAREFAALEEVRVSLKLMPLLSRQAVVDTVQMKGLRANLVRFKDGRTNVDDLAGAPGKPAPAEPAERAPEGAFVIDIDHVVIEDAAITFTDQAAGTRYALDGFNLRTGRIASGVPTTASLSMRVQSDKPRIDVQTELKTRLLYDLDEQRYALQGLDLRAGGAVAEYEKLAVTVRGDVEVRPAAQAFNASGLSLTVASKEAGRDLNVKLEAPRLEVASDKVSGEKLLLEVMLRQAGLKLAAKLDIPGLMGNAKAFKTESMAATLDVEQNGMSARAKLSTPLAGSVEGQRVELTKFDAALQVTHPQLRGKKPVTAELAGSARVDLAKESAGINFSGRIDDSRIKGRADVARFAAPVYTFDVDIDQLDVDRYLAQADAKPKKPVPASKEKPVEEPFDLTGLRNLNANGSIRIGQLVASNVKASNVRVQVKAAGGRIDVSPLSANLYEGTMKGALGVNAAGKVPTFAVQQSLAAVAIGPLLQDLADNDMLEGRGNVKLDVTAQGHTVTALKKALAGSAAVHLADGAVKGINIAETIRNARMKLGALRGEQMQQTDATQKTDFSELSATFKIRDGVAHNSDLALKSPLLRVGGAGTIDIGEDRLDYTVKASIVGTLRGQDGRELSDLRGVTIPVRVSGPLATPAYKLDYGSMVTDAAKQRIQDAVTGELERRLGRPAKEGEAETGGGLRDQLKGLFGR